MFFIGLGWSFLWSLSFLLYPDLNTLETVLACLSAFSIFTIFYWLGVLSVSKVGGLSLGFVFLLIILLGMGELSNVSVVVVYAIVDSPILMILLGLMINALAWRYWGRANLSREYCDTSRMRVSWNWNTENVFKYQQSTLAKRKKRRRLSSVRMSSGVEEFFISKISSAKSGSLQQFVWGAIYKSFGPMVSLRWRHWMWILVFDIPPSLCFLGYLPKDGIAVMSVTVGLMFALRMNLDVYSRPLICVGRKQRFWSSMLLTVARVICITATIAVSMVIIQLLGMVMPDLTIGGYKFVYSAFDMSFSIIPLFTIPATLTIRLILHEKTLLTVILASILISIPLVSIIPDGRVQAGFMQTLIALIFFSWAVFAMVLRYICMRRCLVSQSR